MFYVQSVDRYNAYCNRANSRSRMPYRHEADYYLQAEMDAGEVISIKWGNVPTSLDRGDLVAVLQAIDHKENIEITTNSF